MPTWNYAVVHAHGHAAGPMNREALSRLLDDLVAQHERGAAEPWASGTLDAALRENLLDAIVGMTLVIDRLEGKFKLSQNRSPADYDRVLRALEERGGADDLAMARLMSVRSKRS